MSRPYGRLRSHERPLLVSARRQERKVVTVLFCDLVGFTSKAEEMDPEDVAALLAPYHARLKEELERYGGTVEKFIGDAVMALFGAPVAHEDDPERAVRAALAIREFAEEDGIELRIGITTGEALVTLDARRDEGETMATGDVVNTAARLQSAAPVNGILVGEKTYEATKGTIEYREAEPVEAKGKARPIAVFAARRARARINSSAARKPARRATRERSGRRRACALAGGAASAARHPRRRSRDRQVETRPELRRRRRDPMILAARPLPPVRGRRHALGARRDRQGGARNPRGRPRGGRRRKLREAAVEDWVRTQLRPLVGLSVDAVGEGHRREEAFIAWRRFIEGSPRGSRSRSSSRTSTGRTRTCWISSIT